MIPWLFCGTLVWLYVVLRKGGISVENWLLFLLGKGSYLYYVPMLLTLYIIFWFLGKHDIWIFISILISLVSNAFTYVGLIPLEYAALNVLNWLVYFASGIGIEKWGLRKNAYVEWISGIFVVISLCLVLAKNYYLMYWSPGFLLFSGAGIVWFYKLSSIIAQHSTGRFAALLVKAGNWTMAVYLLHMPIAGIIANIGMRYDSWLLTLLRPILVFFITVSALHGYDRFICRRLKWKWAGKLIGLR